MKTLNTKELVKYVTDRVVKDKPIHVYASEDTNGMLEPEDVATSIFPVDGEANWHISVSLNGKNYGNKIYTASKVLDSNTCIDVELVIFTNPRIIDMATVETYLYLENLNFYGMPISYTEYATGEALPKMPSMVRDDVPMQGIRVLLDSLHSNGYEGIPSYRDFNMVRPNNRHMVDVAAFGRNSRECGRNSNRDTRDNRDDRHNPVYRKHQYGPSRNSKHFDQYDNVDDVLDMDAIEEVKDCLLKFNNALCIYLNVSDDGFYTVDDSVRLYKSAVQQCMINAEEIIAEYIDFVAGVRSGKINKWNDDEKQIVEMCLIGNATVLKSICVVFKTNLSVKSVAYDSAPFIITCDKLIAKLIQVISDNQEVDK